MASLKRWIKNILIGLDQFLWVLLTLGAGSPDETISAASYRLEMDGNLVGRILRPIIDWVAWEEEHCYKSYLAELTRSQLPKEYND